MKKTIILMLLIALAVLCCAGCGKQEETPVSKPTEETQTEENIREQECPICNKTVKWMGLTQAYVDTIRITDDQGKLIDSAIMSGTVFESRHYYLAEDLTYHDSPVMGFFRGPGSGLVSCLDLNDHNITTTATTSVFGNSGVLNVFGNGVVTGFSPNDHEGAAARCGNRNSKNGLNLYGGIYRKTENTAADSPVIAFDGAGRCVSVYDGVVIDGGDGVAVFADSSVSREKDGYLLLQGCTVKGDVKFAPYDGFATKGDFINCTIEGTVIVPEEHELMLDGKVVIKKLSLGKNVRLELGALAEGTAVGIDASGAFTVKMDKVAELIGCFVPTDPTKKITIQDNALSCD